MSILRDAPINIVVNSAPIKVVVNGARGSNGEGGCSVPKIYEAYISQSGTNAPTTLVLTNTLGLNDIVFEYEGDGTYISYSNIYNPLKTSFFIGRPGSALDEANIFLLSPDILQISTKRNYIQFQGGFITVGLTDNILSNTLIRIAIYD